MRLEKKLLLLFSLLGLVLLYIVFQGYVPSDRSISQIGFDDLDDYVRVSGVVVDIRNIKKGKIVRIHNGSVITVPVFSDNDIELGDVLQVSGIVTNYRGTLEIMPRGLKVSYSEPLLCRISDITKNDLYRFVRVRGEVVKKDENGILVNDTSEILVASGADLRAGDFVQVDGIVGAHSSGLRIVPRKITKI